MKVFAKTPALSTLSISVLIGISSAFAAPRSTPGANTGGASKASSDGGNTASSSPGVLDLKAKLGDYVELDDSMKNEMYGTIDFPNAELKDIIKTISQMSKKNFILDRKIENRRVTIISPQAVSKQEVYNAFLSALYMNDLTVVSMGRFLKIVEAKSALQSNIRVFVGDYAPVSEEIVTVLYPLKYLNADEIQRFLTDLVPRNGRISSYPNTNTLVMTDTGLNLRRIVSILKSIDVPGHEDQLENIAIHYASAKGIAQLIDDILEAQNGGRRTGGPARNQPQKTRGGGSVTKIVPDERTNSLVVLANGRGVQELRSLVSKLDSPDAAGGGNIHIYFCKNAVAEELATTINSLISGQKSPSSGSSNNLPPPGGLPTMPGASPVRSSGGEGVRFEGNIKITADKPTNSLVVVASGSDFTALKLILRKLDIPRRQVYVEATIMEINVDDTAEFQAGVNVAQNNVAQVGGFVPTGLPSLTTLASTPAGISGLVAGITSNKTVNVLGPAGTSIAIPSVTALIHALQDSKQGNILHQPQIMTSDNQEAEIKVENKIPVDAGSVSNQTSGTTTQQISRESVTISLKITPQVGKENDLIKLKVDQQIDDFAQASQVAHQIETTTRKANTTVVVRDGDTVVVGGLQKNVSNDVRSKFPLLGDIPILGWFFKGSSSLVKKSNLILFLTPHIINDYSDLMKLTTRKIDAREKLGRDQFDPSDRMIKEVKQFKETAAEDSRKPSPKGWGFKPRDIQDPSDENEEDPPSKKSEDKKSDSVKASTESGETAYMQGVADDQKAKAKEPPAALKAETSAPPPPTEGEPTSGAR